VRVVAGSLRGRTLRAPKGDTTRPTSDRVRESLFAILGDLDGLRVLDLYAGSGALAIEAISRGAASATCVESNRAAIAAITENVEVLGLRDRVSIVTRRLGDAKRVLGERGPFDLVLVDPPYADVTSGALERELRGILGQETKIVAAGALLVLEHAARDAPPSLAPLTLESTRRWGDTAATFYRAPSAGADAETT
jgi:16S rRNA (guanine966-N2)-methyltransferase